MTCIRAAQNCIGTRKETPLDSNLLDCCTLHLQLQPFSGNTSAAKAMNNRSKVQLSRLAHVYFEHPDLEEFEKFAIDFGFVEAKRSKNTTYLRGYGRDQYVYVASKSMDGKAHFRGAAFVAASEDDFNKARELPNAVAQTLEDAPGGGSMVTLSRPENMFLHIIYGQAERDVPGDSTSAAASGLQASFNTPFQKRRRGERPCQSPKRLTF
jgi:hypothetical protein